MIRPQTVRSDDIEKHYNVTYCIMCPVVNRLSLLVQLERTKIRSDDRNRRHQIKQTVQVPYDTTYWVSRPPICHRIMR